MKATIKFKPGQSYETRLISDYDSKLIFKIYRRTDKSVWIDAWPNKVKGPVRRTIKIFGGVETISPIGNYSMAPILSADRPAIKNIKTVNINDIVTDGEEFAKVEQCVHGSLYYAYIGSERSLIQLYDLTEADAVYVSDFHTVELHCCS
jgi:hypothetical protein